MDRKITLLASMALIGTQATVTPTMRYEENSSTLSWPSYKQNNWVSTTIDDLDTETIDTKKAGYECIRTGAWFFFPQRSSKNIPAANSVVANAEQYTQTFYGWDFSAETQTDKKYTSGDNLKAGLNGTSTYVGVIDIGDITSGLDFTSRCCKSFSRTASDSCKRVGDLAHGSTTQANTLIAVQIPYGRIWYKGTSKDPLNNLAAFEFTAANVKKSGALAVAAASGITNALVDYTNAGTPFGATGWLIDQAVFTWNNDFLLASVHQSHAENTGSTPAASSNIVCSSHTDKQWLTIGTAFDNTASPGELKMENYNKKTKCTWFIKIEATASISAAASFILKKADYNAFNLHWAEWTATQLAQYLPTASITPFFTGDYSATYEWPNPIKSGKDRQTPSLLTGAEILFKTTDKSMTPAYGLTRGNVAWYSQEAGPFMNVGINSVDYNSYKVVLGEYNKLVTAYNAAAVTYSTLAKEYNTKVTERLAQIVEDSYTFDTQIAIPPVPCLLISSPPTWPGLKFPTDRTKTMATLDKVNDMFYSFTNADGIVENESIFTDVWDGRSGWMQTATDVKTVDTAATYAGTLHVYGLLGQQTLGTSPALSKTALQAMKAFRFKEETTDNQNHYMMVGVYPYDRSTTYYDTITARTIEITVYKNEWETESPFDFIVQTATGPANFVADDKQLGNAKALAATAAAFAAVAMTLQ